MKKVPLINTRVIGSMPSSAAAVVANFRPSTPKGTVKTEETPVPIGKVLIGETTALEKSILQSRDNTKKVLLAQATIEGVKVEGIGTNVVVMKLLIPLAAVITLLQAVFVWEEPLKSLTFCVVGCYITIKGWLPFLLPVLLVLMAGYMVCARKMRDGAAIKRVLVPTPPNRSMVEQLLALQQALP